MNKVSIEIKDKELQLSKLRIQKGDIILKKAELTDDTIIKHINCLEKNILSLKKQKNNCITEIKKIKELRKLVTTIGVGAFTIIAIIVFFNMPVPMDLLEFILITLFSGSGVFVSTFGPFSILQHREKNNLEFIKKQIEQETAELEKKKTILDEMNKDLDFIDEEINKLDLKIDEIKNEIDYLKQMRDDVIKSFCKNNSQLELLLDNEYNKSEIEKQKVKK